MKALTPDTNFWLHAKLPFDFAAAAGTTDVVVVVPQGVLGELDRHQHEGRRAVRIRARERVMAFRRLLRDGAKRPLGYEATDEGVTLWFVPEPPSATGSADDRIVATAAQLTGEAEVAVLTADASMEMTARLAGMEVVPVPPEMLEHGDVDPLEQEVAQLKREVAKLLSPQPLDVGVRAEQLWPSGVPATLRRLGLPTFEQLAEIQRSLPGRMPRRPPGIRLSSALETYHSELPAYAEAVAAYLAALARYNALAEAAVQVQLLVTNRTAQPVPDAVVEIRAPAGVVLVQLAKPSPPTPPNRPEDRAREEVLDQIGIAHLARPDWPVVPNLYRPDLPPHAPRVRSGEDWAEVKLGEPLRPDFETYGGRLWVALTPDYPDEDIRLPYVLYAAVASRPVRGEIVIRVRHQREPWVQPEMPSYMYPSLQVKALMTQRERQIRAEVEKQIQAEAKD